MQTLRYIRQCYGFGDEKPNYSHVIYGANLDNIGDKDIEYRIEYLKDVLHFEESRQAIIENKISQIIGQSGVVFSLAGLFIPLFFDKLERLDLWEKIMLIILFLISILFYLWSILKATQSYQINNYKYGNGDPNTVLKYFNEIEFKKVMIKDLIYFCETATISNTHKANKLLHANNSFKSGIITMSILLLFFCFFIFSLKPVNEISKIEIANLDSILKVNRKDILFNLDSTQQTNFNAVSLSIKDLNSTLKRVTSNENSTVIKPN